MKTYIERAEELKEDCNSEKFIIQKLALLKAKDLIKEIKEKGCEKMYGEYNGIKDFYFCNCHGICPKCKKAIKICEEILE